MAANTFESVSFDPALDLPSLEQPHRLEKPYTLSPWYIYAQVLSIVRPNASSLARIETLPLMAAVALASRSSGPVPGLSSRSCGCSQRLSRSRHLGPYRRYDRLPS